MVGPGQKTNSLCRLPIGIKQRSALPNLSAAQLAGLRDDTGMAEEPACFAQLLLGKDPFEAVEVRGRPTFSAEECASRILSGTDFASTANGGIQIPGRVLRNTGAP